MQIPINYIQERFPVFAYSTLQKYKKDKEGKNFFSTKKDFYLFLEANYLLELKSRKKLIKIISFKNIYFIAQLKNIEKYIYEPNPIKSLIQDFEKLKQNDFIYAPELIEQTIESLKNNNVYPNEKIEQYINQIIKKIKKYKKEEIINSFKKKLLSKDLNYFDKWVIIEMSMNVKKYNDFLLKKEKEKIKFKKLEKINSIEFYTNNIIKLNIITPNDKEETFFLEYDKKSNKIYIKEKINFNRTKNKQSNNNKELRTKKLEEPKWVYYSDNNTDYYLDHSFNFIEINYEDKYFQYNSLRIKLNTLFN